MTEFRPVGVCGGVTVLVAALIGVLTLAGPVGAHGELVASSPAPGETVGRVTHVDLVFSTTMVDWELSVEGPDGAPVAGEPVQKADPYLSFEAPPISDEGQYIVRYSGTDDDGDIVEGAYAFSIEAGASGPAELPIDLSLLVGDETPWWWYAVLMAGVAVIAVLAGLLAEKLRRLRRLRA